MMEFILYFVTIVSGLMSLYFGLKFSKVEKESYELKKKMLGSELNAVSERNHARIKKYIASKSIDELLASEPESPESDKPIKK